LEVIPVFFETSSLFSSWASLEKYVEEEVEEEQ
jgi:hypothetical protein